MGFRVSALEGGRGCLGALRASTPAPLSPVARTVPVGLSKMPTRRVLMVPYRSAMKRAWMSYGGSYGKGKGRRGAGNPRAPPPPGGRVAAALGAPSPLIPQPERRCPSC